MPLAALANVIVINVREAVGQTNMMVTLWKRGPLTTDTPAVTSLTVTLADTSTNIIAINTGSVSLSPGDLISVQFNVDGGALSNGVSASVNLII